MVTSHTQTRHKAYTGLLNGDFWGSERRSPVMPQVLVGV